MERFLGKIKELERDAQALVNKENRQRSPPRHSATANEPEFLDDGHQSSPAVVVSLLS